MNGINPSDRQLIEASMLFGLPNAGSFGDERNHSYFNGHKGSVSSRQHKYLLEFRKDKQ